MIPATLSDWSIAALSNLLEKAIFEDEHFDFKETLPHRSDEKGKDRVRHSCAAFANSEGGFLVYGVNDSKQLSAGDRICGIAHDLDFPEHFGNFARSCFPSVPWTFRNPPIAVPNGRVLHVVHVPKSWKAPHAVGTLERGWIFPKRTNKGNEAMNMDEVRNAFLGLYEKSLKLELLIGELLMIKQNAQDCAVTEPTKISSEYSLISFDTAIIDSVIADTYSITAKYPALLTELSDIRQQSRIANNKITLFYQIAMIGTTNKDLAIRRHNEFLRKIGERIVGACDAAIAELHKILKR